MKRIKILLMSSIWIGLASLGGCSRFPFPVADHTEETEQEEGFAGMLPLTEADVDYYRSFSGSSSVFTEYAIYQYEDQFIFAVNYFNCGDFYRETFALTEEQTEAFIQELNQCREAEDPDEAEEVNDGGWGADCEISVNGCVYRISGISLTKLGISLEEDPDMQVEVSDELQAYEAGNLGELREAAKAHSSFLKNGTSAEPSYYHMIQVQVGEVVAGTVTKVAVVEKREVDFILELETDQGMTWQATVTYLGYVAEIQELAEN